MNFGPAMFLLMINLFLLLVGIFMETRPAITIFTPMLLPSALALVWTRSTSASSWC